MKVLPAPGGSRPHGAAVQRDELLHQRQADAGALVGAGAGARDAVEALEEARQLARAAMPMPVSRDREHGAVAVGRAGDVDAPARVNLRALDSRLSTIFSHMSRST